MYSYTTLYIAHENYERRGLGLMTPHNACEPFEVGRCADWMFSRPIPRHCHWHPWTDPGANKHSVTSCRVQGNVRHIPPAMQTSSWQRHSEQQGKPLQACLQNPGLGAHSRSRPKQKADRLLKSKVLATQIVSDFLPRPGHRARAEKM